MDDEVHRRARIAAAALDTSVSALVNEYLQQLAAAEVERLKRQQREIRSKIANFTAATRLSREDAHDRPR